MDWKPNQQRDYYTIVIYYQEQQVFVYCLDSDYAYQQYQIDLIQNNCNWPMCQYLLNCSYLSQNQVLADQQRINYMVDPILEFITDFVMHVYKLMIMYVHNLLLLYQPISMQLNDIYMIFLYLFFNTVNDKFERSLKIYELVKNLIDFVSCFLLTYYLNIVLS